MNLVNISSIHYWEETTERKQQHLYVVLCLYQSACSDLVTSLDLNYDKRFSWSVISSYYSIVHSLRTLLFIAIGDFPLAHGKLNEIFFVGNSAQQNRSTLGKSWLPTFDTSFVHSSNSHYLPYFNKNDLIEYYHENYSCIRIDEYLNEIAEILNLSKKIREDSNYESLIIAHEKKHEIIENNFVKLSKIMHKFAKYSLLVSTKCVLNYINQSGLYINDRDRIKWFVKQFITVRLCKALESRSQRKNVYNKVKKITEKLKDSIIINRETEFRLDDLNQYLDIERNTSLAIFNQKRDLMESFEDKVNELNIKIQKLTLFRL